MAEMGVIPEKPGASTTNAQHEAAYPTWEQLAGTNTSGPDGGAGGAPVGQAATSNRPTTNFRASTAAWLDRRMPPYKTYLGMRRRTALIIFAAVIVALLVLIIGLAAGLSARSKYVDISFECYFIPWSLVAPFRHLKPSILWPRGMFPAMLLSHAMTFPSSTDTLTPQFQFLLLALPSPPHRLPVLRRRPDILRHRAGRLRRCLHRRAGHRLRQPLPLRPRVDRLQPERQPAVRPRHPRGALRRGRRREPER